MAISCLTDFITYFAFYLLCCKEPHIEMKQLIFSFSIFCFIATSNTWTTSHFNSELIIKLWNHHDFREPNLVVSSFGMLSPLCALALASSESTRKEIFDALGFVNLDEMTEEYHHEILRMKDSKKVIPITVASTLYIDENLKIKPLFEATIEDLYGIQLAPVNFNNRNDIADQINTWVKKELKDLVEKETILADSISQDNKVLLVNTMYFKSNWKYPFTDAGTQQFHITDTETVNIPTMTVTSKIPYIYVKKFRSQLITIPFQHSSCSMMIILPDKPPRLAHKHSVSHKTQFNNATRYMKSKWLTITIPKLKIETTIDLIKPLKNVRIKEVFSEGNRLDHMLAAPQKLFVNQAYQKTFVNIDESGINTNRFAEKSLHNERKGSKIIKINRPFYFEVGCYDTTLISGIIMNPAHK